MFEIKCSVLLTVAAVLGKLRFLLVEGSSLFDGSRAILLRLVGVFIEFLLSDVSCLSYCLLMLLFLLSNIPFSVAYNNLLMFLSIENLNRFISSVFILSLMSIFRVFSKKFSDELLIEGGRIFFIGIEISCLASYFYVLALQGVFPVSIS